MPMPMPKFDAAARHHPPHCARRRRPPPGWTWWFATCGVLGAAPVCAQERPAASQPAVPGSTAADLVPAGPVAEPAADATPATPAARYVFGLMVSRSPDYNGSAQSPVKLQPLWAWQYGRYRISTSRASTVLGYGGEAAAGPGASAELIDNQKLKAGAALRIDNGRSSSDSPDLAGLPDIRRTVRGRVFVSWNFTPSWSLSGNVSQDLLGHEGGAQASLDLGTGGRLSDRSEWSVGGGITVGNGQYMRTYFGVTEAVSQSTGRAVFRPQGGLRDVHLGLGYTTEVAPHWIAFVGAGASRLLGDAAKSPLTGAATGMSVSAGLAYRWGR